MNQTVEIKGHSPTIQTQGGTVSLGLATRTVRELPVIDRNKQQLVENQTGITPPTTALPLGVDPPRNRFFSADGQSPLFNLWMLDSAYNTEPFRGTANRIVPMEATQQMNIETNSQPENRGFNGGAVTTTISAPGTNGIHGSLFWFNSGSWGRSRNFFSGSNPGFVYNQPGATIGGPIVKDKTFFFGSYEGTYTNGAESTISTVPTAAMLGGDFSAVPGLTLYNPNTGILGFGRSTFGGNVIPGALINPTSASILSLFPAPNQPGLVNNYINNTALRDTGTKADGRIDQHFSDRMTGFLRYGYSNWHDYQQSPLGPVVGSGTRSGLIAQNAIADVTRSITDRLIGDLRIGYNRYAQGIGPYANFAIPNSGVTGSNLLAVPGVNAPSTLMGIEIPGLPSIGTSPFVPTAGVDNTFNPALTFSYHRSRHDFTFGTDERVIRTSGFSQLFPNVFGPNGAAYFGPGPTSLNGGAPLSADNTTFNSLASFLLGAPTQIGAINYLTTPTIRQEQYSAWVGDRFQPTGRITLDLGVRYEAYSPLYSRFAGSTQFFNLANNTFNFNNSTSWDTNDFAPRVGLAARITEKTVFRAGYGWNYFQAPYMFSGFSPTQYGTALGTVGSFVPAPLATPFNGTFSPGPAPTTLVNGMPAGNLPVVLSQSNFKTPYIQNYSAQVQREFYWGTMLSVGYAGSTGRQLPFFQELNTSLPGSGLAALPLLSTGRTASTLLYGNGLTDNYNSLQVSLVKRFSQGISFIASYTWARALGYTDDNLFLSNPFNRSLSYGPLPWSRQSVLTISHIWALPFGQHGNSVLSSLIGGWQLNGVFTWATGNPLTVTADPLACGCGNGTVLASLVPGVNPVLASGTAYLNPAAFTTPAPGTFGNLGRGSIYGPSFRNYDFSLFKNFKIRDRFNLQLRGEAYNLTNSPRYITPSTSFGAAGFGQTLPTSSFTGTGFGEGAFGTQPTAFGFYNRQIDVALRVVF